MLAMQSVDNSRSSGEYYCHLYWVHALIRHCLTTGSLRLLKYMRLISMCASLQYLYASTVVSQVSAHGRLTITCDFGPHGRLPGI